MRNAAPQTALLLLLLTGAAACSTNQAAIDASHAAPRIQPAANESWLGLGKRLIAAGEHELATQAFRRSIAREGMSPLAVTGLGVAAVRQGRLTEGERHLEVAADLAPQSVMASNNLGVVRYRLEDYEGARQAFRHAYNISGRTDAAAAHNLRVAETMLATLRAGQAPHPALSHTVLRTGTSEYRLVAAPAEETNALEIAELPPTAVDLPVARPTLVAAGIAAPKEETLTAFAALNVPEARPAPQPVRAPEPAVLEPAPVLLASAAPDQSRMPSRRPAVHDFGLAIAPPEQELGEELATVLAAAQDEPIAAPPTDLALPATPELGERVVLARAEPQLAVPRDLTVEPVELATVDFLPALAPGPVDLAPAAPAPATLLVAAPGRVDRPTNPIVPGAAALARADLGDGPTVSQATRRGPLEVDTPLRIAALPAHRPAPAPFSNEVALPFGRLAQRPGPADLPTLPDVLNAEFATHSQPTRESERTGNRFGLFSGGYNPRPVPRAGEPLLPSGRRAVVRGLNAATTASGAPKAPASVLSELSGTWPQPALSNIVDPARPIEVSSRFWRPAKSKTARPTFKPLEVNHVDITGWGAVWPGP